MDYRLCENDNYIYHIRKFNEYFLLSFPHRWESTSQEKQIPAYAGVITHGAVETMTIPKKTDAGLGLR